MRLCKADRFDFTISNPPYDGVLHLKVLDTMLALSRRAVFLHPARWVHETQLNSALGLPAKDPMPARLSGMLENVDYIQGKQANLMMKIGGNTDLMVGTYSSDAGSTHISAYPFHVVSAIAKIGKMAKLDNWLPHLERDQRTGNRVFINTFLHSINGGLNKVAPETSMQTVAPHVFVDGMTEDGERDWTETRNRNQFLREKGSTIPCTISFGTVEECHNFISFCNTAFFNNWCQLVTTNQNPKFHLFPWMGDYTHVWTDAELCAHFGLDDQESEFMSRLVPDYRYRDFLRFDDRFKADDSWGTHKKGK